MATKQCVACHRAIAQSFMVCNFCKAEQPRISQPPAPREKRCATCKRPYSARLAECPFCAQTKQPSVRPSGIIREAAVEEEETRDPRAALVNVSIFAVPLGLGLLWGVARLLTVQRLGGEESTGLLVPSILIGLVVATGVALGYVGRAYHGLGEAFSEEGGKGLLAIAFAIAIVPSCFTAYAGALWINSFGIDAREQDVTCTAGRANQISDGWTLPYACTTSDNQLLRGSVKHLAANPGFAEDKPFRFRATRGTLGIWLRLSDPLPPKAEL